MIKIQKAKPEECQQIRKLEQQVWKEENIVSPYDSAYFTRFGCSIIAKDGTKIVGALIAMYTGQNDIIVIDLVVSEKYRTQGIGSKLIRKLEKQCPGKNIISWVSLSNTASIKTHEKAGFKKIKKLQDPFYIYEKKYYWLMEKNK